MSAEKQPDDAAMQAECVVRALDSYLSTFPWPSLTIQSSQTRSQRDAVQCRKLLVDTLAATIRMSEPRHNPLQYQRRGPLVKPNTVKRIRTSLGLTQEEAGKLFGGGPRAFQKYENGDVAPSAAMARLLYCADRFPAMLGVLGMAVALGKVDGEEDEAGETDERI